MIPSANNEKGLPAVVFGGQISRKDAEENDRQAVDVSQEANLVTVSHAEAMILGAKQNDNMHVYTARVWLGWKRESV